VPLDYRHPRGKLISIAEIRHRATDPARRVGTLFRARLLTVKGFRHTAFYNPSVCASNYEVRYLITGALPPRGTVCPQTVQPFPPAGS